MDLCLDGFARFRIYDRPTPIQRLERLEAALAGEGASPRIYVKRDDLNVLGSGGNKLRKLEFLIGDALAKGCDTFITTGAWQSNHARLSAFAAARAGLACELVLADVVDRQDEAYRRNGNAMLDGLAGARRHPVAGGTDTLAFADERAATLRREGRQAYVVGAGGSSPVGCLGYAACAREIVLQEAELGIHFSRIIVANGSSGTQAGLVAGCAAMELGACIVQGYTVLAPSPQAHAETLALARRTLALFAPNGPTIEEEEVVVDGSQRGEGYGVPTAAMLGAVRLLARTEGLLLDPVYSGKAFAGLLAAIRAGEYSSRDSLLFIMTGGVPGLYAYEPAFR